jgi:exopolysaccharide biosynthesis glucuronosyltransferase PssE
LIFVTVGTQLAFDRLVGAVDRWAATRSGADVFAQIGPSALRPRHIRHQRFMTPAECRERMLAAEAIVAHAGMGTVLSALEMGTPLLVMPRRAALGEHRNDHQLATAHQFSQLGSLSVAFDEAELHRKLDALDRLAASNRIGPHAPDPFIAALRAFIGGEPAAASTR